MTAINQDLTMNEGETKKIVVAETADEDNGGTVNISNINKLSWVLKQSKQADILVEKTESGSNDITITDATNGGYEITIQPEDTESEVVGARQKLYHRVRLTDNNGRTSDLLEGEITVENV